MQVPGTPVAPAVESVTFRYESGAEVMTKRNLVMQMPNDQFLTYTYPSCILVCFAGTGTASRLQCQFHGDWPKLIYKYHEGRKTKHVFLILLQRLSGTTSLSKLGPQTHSRLSIKHTHAFPIIFELSSHLLAWLS